MIAYSLISINIDLQFLLEFSVVGLITDLSISMIFALFVDSEFSLDFAPFEPGLVSVLVITDSLSVTVVGAASGIPCSASLLVHRVSCPATDITFCLDILV